MVFQCLSHFALDTGANRCRGVVVKIDLPVEAKNMFQEFELLDFH